MAQIQNYADAVIISDIRDVEARTAVARAMRQIHSGPVVWIPLLSQREKEALARRLARVLATWDLPTGSAPRAAGNGRRA